MKLLTPLLVAACMSHILTTQAQSAWLGLKGGFSTHTLRNGGDPYSEHYSAQTGGTIGLTSEFVWRRHLSLVCEFYYTRQGGKRDGIQPVSTPAFPAGLYPPGVSTIYANISNEVKINYFQLPIMARLTWGKAFQFYINAGFLLGFQFNLEYKQSGFSPIYADSKGQHPVLEGGNPIASVTFDDAYKDDFSSLTAGVTGGAGIAIQLDARNRLFFDARYDYGFTAEKFNDNKPVNTLLTLGYVFRPGSK